MFNKELKKEIKDLRWNFYYSEKTINNLKEQRKELEEELNSVKKELKELKIINPLFKIGDIVSHKINLKKELIIIRINYNTRIFFGDDKFGGDFNGSYDVRCLNENGKYYIETLLEEELIIKK